jgi:uncharacterized RDD family membrane protein YckC
LRTTGRIDDDDLMLDYPIGTRVAAAVIDGLVTALVTTLFWALPVMVFGLTLPVLAVTAAVLCVSVLPVSAFGASPGKAILGLEVRSRMGAGPTPSPWLSAS